MKKFFGVVIAVAFVMVSVSAMAKEKAAPKEKPEKGGGLVELTLTGKIAKGDAEGSFVLIDADNNKIELPKPKAGKGDEKAINLADFVDQQVTVKAKGMEPKGDKKVATVKQILSVEKVAADAKPAGDAKAPAAGGEVK